MPTATQHKKKYGVYHCDTFDNETLLIDEFDTLEQAVEFANERYEGRISDNGADQVDIVSRKGDIVVSLKVT